MERQRWLIAYDIADSRRLQRARRLLCTQTLPLQNSVYLFRGSQDGAQQLLAQLAEQLNAREDDLRLYPLPPNARLLALSGSALPQGILLSGYEEENLANHSETG